MSDLLIEKRIAAARDVCEETFRFLHFLNDISRADTAALEAARAAHAEMIERRIASLFNSHDFETD